MVYYKSRRSNDCIMPQAFTSSKNPVDFDHSKNMFQYIYKLPIPFALTTPDNRLGIKCLPNSNMICIAIYLYAHLFKLQSNGRGHLSLKDKSTFLQNFLSNPNRYVYTVEEECRIHTDLRKKTYFFWPPIRKAPEQVLNLRRQLSSSILSFVWHWSKLGLLLG